MPDSFGGYGVKFGVVRDPGSGVRHRVEVFGLGGWLAGQLGFDPRAGVRVPDWLGAPWQRLAEVTGGAVFEDRTGELTRVRSALSWYPRDLWYYVLSCQWSRIAAEEAFPGRCAEAGDELGSAMDSTPALGSLRYPRAVIAAEPWLGRLPRSDRDMSVVGSGITKIYSRGIKRLAG
jgi:hypothetical protein